MFDRSNEDGYRVQGTVENPVGVPYLINRGTTVSDRGGLFGGSQVTLTEGISAILDSISGQKGNFHSLQPTEVKTAKLQTVPKPLNWNFSTSLYNAKVQT